MLKQEMFSAPIYFSIANAWVQSHKEYLEKTDYENATPVEVVLKNFNVKNFEKVVDEAILANMQNYNVWMQERLDEYLLGGRKV